MIVIGVGIILGLLMQGCGAMLTTRAHKYEEKSIAMVKAQPLRDGRTLGEALEALYGSGGKWKSTTKVPGFIVKYQTPNTPEIGAGRPPCFWVELKPAKVKHWCDVEGRQRDWCRSKGISFEGDEDWR